MKKLLALLRTFPTGAVTEKTSFRLRWRRRQAEQKKQLWMEINVSTSSALIINERNI